MQLEQYRGPITNRGLTTALNRRDGTNIVGNLDMLGIGLPELVGKKILNVGIGGGKAVEHALECGLNCFGIDILPLIDITGLDAMKKAVVTEQMAEYTKVQQRFPERIRAANFCRQDIPYDTDEFDVVFSAVALPEQARTPTEAAISILNMVKVAKEKVVFHCGWNPSITEAGIVTLGIYPWVFNFGMKAFVEGMTARTGVSYELSPVAPTDLNTLVTTLTLHTVNKDAQALQSLFNELCV